MSLYLPRYKKQDFSKPNSTLQNSWGQMKLGGAAGGIVASEDEDSDPAINIKPSNDSKKRTMTLLKPKTLSNKSKDALMKILHILQPNTNISLTKLELRQISSFLKVKSEGETFELREERLVFYHHPEIDEEERQALEAGVDDVEEGDEGDDDNEGDEGDCTYNDTYDDGSGFVVSDDHIDFCSSSDDEEAKVFLKRKKSKKNKQKDVFAMDSEKDEVEVATKKRRRIVVLDEEME
jgi:hypothetical protein